MRDDGDDMRSIRQETSLRFWMLGLFLIFVLVTGGGSRPDILSLIVLRPMAVLACAFAAWTITPEELRRQRFPFIIALATTVLILVHLVPLPPALWQSLPGRNLVTRIDHDLGLGAVWRPISLSPPDTWNAFFSMAVPSAVLLAGAQVPRSGHERLLFVLILAGLTSGVLGLLQLLGSPTGPLFLYKHTNYGTATGFFANRNHQAIFLATVFPMLGAFVTLRSRTPNAARHIYGAIAIGVLILPLLLITGSRAGIAVGLLGLASLPFLVRLKADGRRGGGPVPSRIVKIVGAAAGIGLVAAMIVLSRAVSITRLFDMGAEDELRFKVWPIIIDAIGPYFPIGSGIGSFAPVFQVVETDRILRPTFLNHAHSEVLEILLTAGFPGAILLLAATLCWIVAALRAFRQPIGQGEGALFLRLGVVVIGLLAAGSIADYPLRTPFMAALLALAALWCGGLGHQSAKRRLRSA